MTFNPNLVSIGESGVWSSFFPTFPGDAAEQTLSLYNTPPPKNIYILRGLNFATIVCFSQITDMAMQCLSHGAAQYLRELDVSGCTLTDRAIRYIERLCPPLSSITMHGCNRISE